MKQNKIKQPQPLDNQAEAMEASIGQTFESDKYIRAQYSDHKTKQKALQVLSYLQDNIDPSIIRFGSQGGIFYKGTLVPDANLSSTLKNLVTKSSKTLEHGEYYLISVLTHAPQNITKLISPSKLKICNIQQRFSDTGLTGPQKTPTSQPAKIIAPPIVGHNSNIEFRTANPFVYKPSNKQSTTFIAKPPTSIPKKKQVVTGVQKRYNTKTIPAWYKVL